MAHVCSCVVRSKVFSLCSILAFPYRLCGADTNSYYVTFAKPREIPDAADRNKNVGTRVLIWENILLSSCDVITETY